MAVVENTTSFCASIPGCAIIDDLGGSAADGMGGIARTVADAIALTRKLTIHTRFNKYNNIVIKELFDGSQHTQTHYKYETKQTQQLGNKGSFQPERAYVRDLELDGDGRSPLGLLRGDGRNAEVCPQEVSEGGEHA